MVCTEEPTYEEQAILNWYLARKEFNAVKAIIDTGNLSGPVIMQKAVDDLVAAEEVLVNIAMDLNVKKLAK